ncbi:hypothetical protein [Thiohalocapsa sp.]|uniref:hypothetical protein n=1 Tax=Thiohalocapsa sp. TaxID=2497641 RepID=UPI0025F1259F|nr:hypothetical protein [Thiohalocapsa sp.]
MRPRDCALEPKAAFLTHDCRIDDPARHAHPLRRGIKDLAAIALAQAEQPAVARKDRIKNVITAHLLAEAREHGCALVRRASCLPWTWS